MKIFSLIFILAFLQLINCNHITVKRSNSIRYKIELLNYLAKKSDFLKNRYLLIDTLKIIQLKHSVDLLYRQHKIEYKNIDSNSIYTDGKYYHVKIYKNNEDLILYDSLYKACWDTVSPDYKKALEYGADIPIPKCIPKDCPFDYIFLDSNLSIANISE